ncbi:hypothetical protein ACW5WN_12935 [Aeromonas lacus]
MPYHTLFLIISTIFYVSTELFDVDSPFSSGHYNSDGYRAPIGEPETTIKTRIHIDDDGNIEKTMVLHDPSLKSEASFHFSSHLFFCYLKTCLVYIPKGELLVKAEMKGVIYYSQYLQILSNYKKSHLGCISLLYKDKDMVFFRVNANNKTKYHLYTVIPEL